MTGKEHYQEAERLLKLAAEPTLGDGEQQALAAMAQAHTTLALVQAQLAIGLAHPSSIVSSTISYMWGDR